MKVNNNHNNILRIKMLCIYQIFYLKSVLVDVYLVNVPS